MRSSAEATFLPGSEAIDAVYRGAGAQSDNLCGPYWISLVLRARGLERDQVRVAIAAGTLLPAGGDPASWVPRGEPNREAADAAIARTADPRASGTSVVGLSTAVREVSDGELGSVAVRGVEGADGFDADALGRFAGLLGDHAGWRAAPILNLRTGPLWGTRPSLGEVFAYLAGADVAPPPAEWDVGHFVNVAGVLRGPSRAMLLVRDSYPSFGWGGYHVQPLDAVAAALRRGDGVEGGCLLIASAADVPEIERELKASGFEIGLWDNGTPYEGGDR